MVNASDQPTHFFDRMQKFLYLLRKGNVVFRVVLTREKNSFIMEEEVTGWKINIVLFLRRGKSGM